MAESRSDQEGGGAGPSKLAGLSCVWVVNEKCLKSQGETKRREVELGSQSWLDCLASELFLGSCVSGHCLCDFVLHSCWSSNWPSTQAALHWRGPHLLNIVVLKGKPRKRNIMHPIDTDRKGKEHFCQKFHLWLYWSFCLTPPPPPRVHIALPR